MPKLLSPADIEDLSGMSCIAHTNRSRMAEGLPEVWTVYDADWNVLGFARKFTLHRARFVVNPSGVERIRATGIRPVVAWVEGTVAPSSCTMPPDNPHRCQELKFNPFRNATFVDSWGNAIESAPWVCFTPSAALLGPA